MLRLKLWTRIGLLALVLAAGATWVTVSVSPAMAAGSGVKSLDPGDPSNGGGTTSGDPDGPTGDNPPAGGSLYSGSGSALAGGHYGSTVQTSTTAAAKQPMHWFDWARIKVALGDWLHRSIFGY